MSDWPHIDWHAPDVPEYVAHPEYHAVINVQLIELFNDGWFDPSADNWKWDYYSEEQYVRVCQKIIDRFAFRCIGMEPYKWKRAYVRRMNEIMPKYKPLYAKLEAGVDITGNRDSYGKSRDIHSEFPATMLGDNQDYASWGNDREFENVEVGNWIDTTEAIARRYNDVDVLILDELENIFSCLLTVSMNGW